MFVFYCYLLSVTFLTLFLYGFFPLQTSQTGNEVALPNVLFDFEFEAEMYNKSEVNRVVLIVIDALRMDFVHEENMPFLVNEFKREGCFLKTKVESPTVTLPRIKALTTGSVPQFADVVLNLAGGEVLRDSILHRIKDKGKNVIFYGDDTWVKLFPGIFTRYEGVSSFFVNDFTEVDDNVTRNVITELDREDWDVMVLHYLGLDHIGHVFGPNSMLVGPKLREMDEIVEHIFLRSKKWDKTLIMVTGDHGMKDSGGHGGATYSETHVPFIVLGTNCKNDTIAQVDIPPSLAAILGVTIPRNNIGRVISNLFPSFSTERLLYSLHYNVKFLQNKSNNHDNDLFRNASILHYNFLKTKNPKLAAEAQVLYQECARQISQKLVESSVTQNVPILILSVTILIGCLGSVVYHQRKFLIKTNSFLVFGTVMHILSLFSSSFIEEEHQVWYLFFSSFMFVLLLEKKVFGFVIVLFSVRLLRTLNQTGDKWAHLPDVSDFLLLEENLFYLYAVLGVGLVLTWCCFAFYVRRKMALILNAAVIFSVLLFHVYRTPIFAKFTWFFIVINVVSGLFTNHYEKYLLIGWVSFCLPLVRSYNVILLPLCMITSIILCKKVKKAGDLLIVHIWLGRMYFFGQGHGNSLASIDVASGYAGMEEYVPHFVMFQVFCHTYTFPVLANLLLINHKLLSQTSICNINILCRLPVLIFICILILIQRHHLFVWTVFAPKLLMESCHSFALFLQIVIFYLLLFIRKKCTKLLKFIKKDPFF